jgi:hypothetical protein
VVGQSKKSYTLIGPRGEHTLLTLRSVSSLNNPQNSETIFCEKYEVHMLKIIIMMIGYTLSNFIIHLAIS